MLDTTSLRLGKIINFKTKLQDEKQYTERSPLRSPIAGEISPSRFKPERLLHPIEATIKKKKETKPFYSI